MKDTLLFNSDKVLKFFDILKKTDRCVSNIYSSKNKKSFLDSNEVCYDSAREVFVRRTIKWLKGKHIIWYRKSEQTDAIYKCYISISDIQYALYYGTKINVWYYDFSRPVDNWNKITLNCFDCMNLEGEWCENNNLHNELLDKFLLQIPEKEYVFKTYDWSQYQKIDKKNNTEEKILNLISSTISFKAKTREEAYKLKKDFEKNNDLLTISPDIIEIKYL